MAISGWARRLLPSRPQYEITLAWGSFPPLQANATEKEVADYLDQCSFGSAAVDTNNQLMITILDPNQQVWTFRFPRAGLSVERWPDDPASEDWEPGIQYLATSLSRTRDRAAEHSYELESRISISIVSDAVRVVPPAVQH